MVASAGGTCGAEKTRTHSKRVTMEVIPTIDDIRSYAWRRGKLRYLLWPQQDRIYERIKSLDPKLKTIVMLCARQFGKSFLAEVMAVEDCLQYPGITNLVVGPTIKQTIDIAHQALRKIALESPPGLIRRSKSESRWYVGDSEIVIGGFDVTNATRQRGKTIHNIYIEELVDSKPDAYLEALRADLGPALTHSKSGRMYYFTTLPRIPDHPFITNTMVEAQNSGAFYSFTIDDNEQLSEEQYQACVDRCGGKDTIEFRREYLNQQVRDAGLMVVPDYEEKTHVMPFTNPINAFYQVAGDYGGVRDKTVMLLHSYDFQSDVDLVLDEAVFQPNTPTNIIVEGIRAMEQRNNVPIHMRYIDGPHQLVHVDLQASHGLEAQVPFKQDWRAGINYMAVRFSTKKILVHPRCEFLRLSLRSGTLNSTRTDFERTLTLGHCDALAALMYGLKMMDRTNPFSTQIVPGGTMYISRDRLQASEGTAIKRLGKFK